MSDFKQAIKWLKEKKKVKRSNYGEGAYKVMREDGFISYQGSGSLPHFRIEDYEANDWEIYCEEHEWIFEHVEGDSCGHNEYACKQLKCRMGRCKNCGIEKPKETLSDGFEHWEKLLRENKEPILIIREVVRRVKKITKEKIQNAQKRLEKDAKNLDEFDGTYKVASEMMGRYIENIFKEEFGELR